MRAHEVRHPDEVRVLRVLEIVKKYLALECLLPDIFFDASTEQEEALPRHAEISPELPVGESGGELAPASTLPEDPLLGSGPVLR